MILYNTRLCFVLCVCVFFFLLIANTTLEVADTIASTFNSQVVGPPHPLRKTTPPSHYQVRIIILVPSFIFDVFFFF